MPLWAINDTLYLSVSTGRPPSSSLVLGQSTDVLDVVYTRANCNVPSLFYADIRTSLPSLPGVHLTALGLEFATEYDNERPVELCFAYRAQGRWSEQVMLVAPAAGADGVRRVRSAVSLRDVDALAFFLGTGGTHVSSLSYEVAP